MMQINRGQPDPAHEFNALNSLIHIALKIVVYVLSINKNCFVKINKKEGVNQEK